MSDYQFYLIALFASVVVFVLNQLYQRTGKKIPAAYLTVGVYVASFVLAVMWKGVVLPPAPVCVPTDPGACAVSILYTITNFLQNIGGYVAFAALIYQAFLKQIMEKYYPSAWRKV
jgi:predicted PurR-regulated permease PerM